MQHKSFFFLQTRAPLEAGPEAFDLALTAAAFDHDVRLVLADDGVQWLRPGLPEIVTEAVEQIAVERESLAERGMEAPEGMTIVTREEVTAQLAGSDVVVTG